MTQSLSSLYKEIWGGLQQLSPDDICVSKEHGYSYQFFRGYKIIKNTDTTISVYDTHINDYYTDKYGYKRINHYPLVKSAKALKEIKDKIYVELNNKQNILSP